MIILQSKAGQGKSKEIIKRFITDEKSATLITDEMGLNHIHEIIELLKQEGHEISNEGAKIVKTGQYVNCNADYYGYVYDNGDVDNIYLDIHIPRGIFKEFMTYCKSLEVEYGGAITLVDQLPMNSDVAGVNVVEV